MSDVPRTRLTRDNLAYVLATGSRAPSVHNTQPWRWSFADGVLDLRVDPSRRLHVTDPHGRELVVSCGAALYNVALAIRRLGLEPRIRPFPDADEPQLLAQVRALPGGPPTKDELRQLIAIMLRHTHRGAFTDSAPSPELLDDMRVAARADGARLVIVPDGPEHDRIIDLAWQAEVELGSDLAWQGEMSSWSPPLGSARRDGVPADAYPASPPARVPRQLPGRDFSLGRKWGTGESDRPGASVLAVLVTNGDGPANWLQAGRALQHVLLTAAAERVFASFATQPLELPEIRSAVHQASGLSGFPQMLFRLGHAPLGPQTPRRPVRDILTVE